MDTTVNTLVGRRFFTYIYYTHGCDFRILFRFNGVLLNILMTCQICNGVSIYLFLKWNKFSVNRKGYNVM